MNNKARLTGREIISEFLKFLASDQEIDQETFHAVNAWFENDKTNSNLLLQRLEDARSIKTNDVARP